MERHHEAVLQQALDELYLYGAVSILWAQLYLWFGAERLGKGSYRELSKRWQELCTITYGHAEAPELLVLHFDGPTLNLQRRPFEGEEVVPLSEWM